MSQRLKTETNIKLYITCICKTNCMFIVYLILSKLYVHSLPHFIQIRQIKSRHKADPFPSKHAPRSPVEMQQEQIYACSWQLASTPVNLYIFTFSKYIPSFKSFKFSQEFSRFSSSCLAPCSSTTFSIYYSPVIQEL